jgi:Zn-dependent peptidase ImmA (M78 family)/DNA-binding XRE family transcriptional regulator
MDQMVNPDMIALARESRGMTQSDLARSLNVTQGLISKIETGHIGVSPDMVSQLSRFLNYPEKFFYQRFQVYPAGMHFHRCHKSLSSRKQLELTARMNISRKHVRELLQAADIDYKPLPELDIDELGSPEEAARAFRHYLRLPRGPIENLTEVLEDSGILVVQLDAGTRLFSGASMLADKPNYVIFVNRDIPGDRLRHTLAHELGHILMHPIPNPYMEEQADRFASELLMPIRDIGQYLKDLSLEKLATLKGYWMVSMASILVKAYREKKIIERQYRYLWMRMSKAQWKLREPPALDIPPEQPSLVSELIELHLKELGYSVEQLSDKLAFDADEFRSLYIPARHRLKLLRKTG